MADLSEFEPNLIYNSEFQNSQGHVEISCIIKQAPIPPSNRTNAQKKKGNQKEERKTNQDWEDGSVGKNTSRVNSTI